MGSLKRTLELGQEEPKISLPPPLRPDALAPHIAARRGSATLRISEKANEMRNAGEEVYALGFGQSPFPVPACMVRKLKEHAEVNKYLPVRGHPHLRQAIAEWAVHHKGVSVTAEDVMVGPGSKQLIYLLQAVLQCQLLLPRPSWVSYAPQAELLGREVLWVETSEQQQWQLQAEALEAACQSSRRPCLLIFNNPCNPTGTACTAEQVKALAEVARKHRLLVLADEIYDLVQFDGKHESFAKHYPEGTIILTGISKTSGGGGWRMGAFVFPPGLRWILDAMAVYASETHSSVSAPIQFGSIPAFQTHHDSEEAQAMRHYHQASRQILAAVGQRFADVVNADAGGETRVVPPTGGFYAWLNAERDPGTAARLRRRGLASAEELADQLLRDTGVATLPGDAYGWDKSKLCLHIAFVDFDGAQAIEHVAELPRFQGQVDPEGDAKFVEKYAPRVVLGAQKMRQWLDKMGQETPDDADFLSKKRKFQ